MPITENDSKYALMNKGGHHYSKGAASLNIKTINPEGWRDGSDGTCGQLRCPRVIQCPLLAFVDTAGTQCRHICLP